MTFQEVEICVFLHLIQCDDILKVFLKTSTCIFGYDDRIPFLEIQSTVPHQDLSDETLLYILEEMKKLFHSSFVADDDKTQLITKRKKEEVELYLKQREEIQKEFTSFLN
jgi:hypothetical protein